MWELGCCFLKINCQLRDTVCELLILSGGKSVPQSPPAAVTEYHGLAGL